MLNYCTETSRTNYIFDSFHQSFFFFHLLLFHRLASTYTTLSSDTCQPVTKIVYIKTHKTGSGTTTSILDRYGFSHNLTFAVPAHGPIIYGLNDIYQYKRMISRGGFDILDNHFVNKRQQLEKVIPEATYITSIRDPVTHFESAFVKFKVAKLASIKDQSHPMTAFFKKKPFRKQFKRFNDNFQLRYLGENKISNNTNYFTKLFKRLDLEFDLIIIMEHYVESLVLMKNLLCWKLDDVVFISQHVRTDSKHLETMTTSLRNNIERFNFADMKLYQHYNRTLWTKIGACDQDIFWKEVEYLRKKLKDVADECITGTKVTSSNGWIVNIGPGLKSTNICDDYLRSVGPGADGNIQIKKHHVDEVLASD